MCVYAVVQHCRRQLTLYFRCTANVTVHVIKKLLCMKLEIGRPLTVCLSLCVYLCLTFVIVAQ